MYGLNMKRILHASRLHSRYKRINKVDVVRRPADKSLSFGGAAVWMSGITLFITLLSITFYGAGKAYRVAYLRQFGVTDSMLPWSTQDLVYLGITKQLDTILWAYPALAGFMLLMILFMWGSHKTGKYLEKRFALKTATRTTKNPALDGPYGETAFLLLIILTGLVLFLLTTLCLIYIAKAETMGKTEGHNDHRIILEGDEKSLKDNGLLPGTFEILNEGKSNSATVYLFSCSDKACFGLEKTTKRIFYVPLDKRISFYTTSNLSPTK